MTFYKIIQNGTVIDVGSAFLKWSTDYHRMLICDVNQGQFVCSIDGERKYRDQWMRPCASEATGYENAEVVVIEEGEFRELLKLLSEGDVTANTQQIEEENVEQIPEPTKSEQPEETILTIGEMRKLLLAQQKQIDELLSNKNNLN